MQCNVVVVVRSSLRVSVAVVQLLLLLLLVLGFFSWILGNFIAVAVAVAVTGLTCGGRGGGYLGGVLLRAINVSGQSTAISRCGPAKGSCVEMRKIGKLESDLKCNL